MTEGLQIERAEHTLIVTADRGEENLYTTEMIDALCVAVDAAARDGLRFVRLRARGPVFCVGRERAGTTPLELRAEAALIVGVNETFRTTPLTVIAEVSGDAAGFGVGLVAAADVAIAGASARFWFPEVLGGLAPTIVISWLSKSVPYKIAYDLVTTGDPIDAKTARTLGLVTEVADDDAVEWAVDDRIKRLSDMSPGAIKEIKEFFVRTRGLDPGESAIASVEALALSAVRNRAEKA
ncbi:MAG: enoyl-CoA hydratase/isomerase family protein [Actinomycetota bacterium]